MTLGWLRLAVIAAVLAGPVVAEPLDDLRAGNAAYERGEFQDAVAAYTAAIISGQLSVEALAVTFNNRGVAYGELGDFDRAILDYSEALGLRPDDATATRNLRVGHLRRGIARAERNDVDGAIADFTRAIEIDPSHYLAYLRRGELRLGRNERAAALQDLERAAALAPEDANVAAALERAQAAAAALAPAAGPATPAPDSVTVVRPSDTAPAAAPPAAAPQTPPSAAPAGAARVRTRQAVNVREGPGNEFARITTVPAGTDARVIEVVKGWNHVELGDGRRGWIFERFLGPPEG